MKKKSRNIRLGVILNILIFLAGFLFLLINDQGIYKYFQLRSKLADLNTEISEAEKKVAGLDAEIDSLQNNLKKIETVARENYYMKKENEQALEVEED